jgi:hypothetical protein
MAHLLLSADQLLRGAPWAVRPAQSGRAALHLLGFVLLFGLAYGAVMGTFGGITGQRLLQVLYSGIKVPLLLLVTFAISLPSFFVLNTLLGVRDDFGQAVRALMATQAGLTIILVSLAPFTLFWYASSDHYRAAILFNGFMFAVASFGAQLLLRRYYGPLIRRNPRHRWLVRCWLIIYAFVGIQMGWILRPFIGDPALPTRFFREDAWGGNAYVVVMEMIWAIITR